MTEENSVEQNTSEQAPEQNTQEANVQQQPTEGGKTFTQEELNQIAGKSREEGRNKAVNDWLSEFGLEDEDSLKALVQQHNERIENEKSEAQRVTEQRDSLQSQYDEVAEQLAAMQFQNEATSALRQQGVPDEYMSDALQLLDENTIGFDEESGQFTGISEAAQSFVESRPMYVNQQQTRRAPQVSGNQSPANALSGTDARLEEAQQKGDRSSYISIMREKLANQRNQ